MSGRAIEVARAVQTAEHAGPQPLTLTERGDPVPRGRILHKGSQQPGDALGVPVRQMDS